MNIISLPVNFRGINNRFASTPMSPKYSPAFGASKVQMDGFFRSLPEGTASVESKESTPSKESIKYAQAGFRKLGIKYDIDKNDNKFTIHGGYTSDPKRLEKYHVDEEKLLENVKVVKGSLDLVDSKLKSINVEEVYGSFILSHDELFGYNENNKKINKSLERADKLEYCFGSFRAGGSNLKSAKALNEVTECLDISHTKNLERLDDLERCGADFYANDSNLKSAKALKRVGMAMDVRNCPNLTKDSFSPQLKVGGALMY